LIKVVEKREGKKRDRKKKRESLKREKKKNRTDDG
jgi:hypothetical protein